MSALWVILLSVGMGAVGQVLLKAGANRLGELSLAPATLIPDIFRMIKTPEILIGLILFGTSFLLWVKVLTKVELSYAYPMMSLSYVIVFVMSFLWFQEAFTMQKLVGMAVIIIGIIIINK
ncbi:EamA family transporter [Paenibacillus sp. UNC499MF]|uniref:EamA family transporter n=1 Tax=Paenibacillus sp. UNC499MF TaxID=1502751 RepID=UPI0008A016EC|nr:EamA family transporter [Paenibacillus sp. UNC499MF]SEF60792.1 EamA-like transporter family protein [Paenibacillus sp. UNC499MF]